MEVEQLKQQRCFSDLSVARQPFSYPLGLCQPKEQGKALDRSGGVDTVNNLIWLSVGTVVRVYLLHYHGEGLNHPLCVELLWFPLTSKLLQ